MFVFLTWAYLLLSKCGVHTFDPSTWKAEAEDFYELEVNLSYMASETHQPNKPKNLYILIFMCVCLLMPYVCRCLWRPEKGVRSPGAVVKGDCEPPDVSGGGA